ncbi:cupin domain-containing protein [Quadrisphaera sp. KR29]|uniref:cupin domain-containing protein n=1 Tax=Quadrisphaera sp. KR29 TaxID=3461391 RepID=UPI004044E262
MTAELERELTAPVPSGTGAGPSPLARCFDTTPERFAAERWNRTPLLLRAADRSWSAVRGFDDLLSPADVDELLGPRGLRTPFFAMVKDGVSLPRSSYTRTANAGNQRLGDLPDPDGIARNHAEGATIVLNALHRVWPPLAVFCRDLAAELGCQTQTNVYVTPPGAQGFKPHHDTHDVLVLQVDGRKHWTIHPPAVELPLRTQPSKDLGPDPVGGRAPIIDAVLEPGDALYLPRGYLHSAQTTDERSIHLTVGLLATTWQDVLTDLLAGAGTGDGEESLVLRRALPLPVEAEGPTGVEPDVAAFRRAALAWLEQLDDAAVERVVAARRRQAVPLEPVGPLAQDRAARTLGPRGGVRPRIGLSTRVRTAGERVELLVGQRTVSFPGWVEPALRAALAGPTSPSSLAAGGAGIDVDDAQVLLRRLLRERVLVPAGAAPEGLR